jgi:hypothetical protein
MAKDPYAGLASEIVELPFTEGLANKFSQHFRPDPKSALLTVENAKLHEVGKFSNRDGFVSLSNTRVGDGATSIQSTQQKLFQRKGELGIIANAQIALGSGAGWGGDGDTLLTFTPNMPAGGPTGSWKAHGKVPRPTLGNIGNLTPDTNTRVSDCAVAGNFMLVAWHTATQIDSVYGNIYFRVIDITNNTTVVDTTQCPASGTIIPGRTNTQIPAIGTNAARGNVGNGFQAKLQCVALGNRFYVFLLAAADATNASSNTLCAFYIDMSVANPAPSALLSLIAGVQTYSVCTDGTAIYVARVLAAAPLAIVAVKYDTNLNILGANTIATLGGAEIGVYDLNNSAAAGAHAVACTTYRTVLGVGSYGVAEYVMMCDTTNALNVTGTPIAFAVYTGTAFPNTSNIGLWRPDIVVLTSTTALVCVTAEDNAQVLCLFWGLVGINAGAMAVGTTFQAQGVTNVARLFTQAGRAMLPVAKVNYWPASGFGIDAGFFLVELEAAQTRGGTDLYRLPMLAANWSTDISAPVLDTNGASPYQPLDYGPIMVAGGGATLVITLVSTKTNQDGTTSGILLPVPIKIAVFFAGAFGNYVLQISYDGGATYVQKITSAAARVAGGFWSAALDGPGAGFSIRMNNTTSVAGGQSWTASYLSTRQIALPNGAISGNKYYTVTRSGSAFGNKPTPLFSNYVLDGIVLDFADAYRWASRASNALTLFGAASMFAYDGRRTFEASVPVRPRIPSIVVQTGVNALTPSADGNVDPTIIRPGIQYFFRAVVTWLDANGDRWFSAPSYASRNGDAFSAVPRPYTPGGAMLQYTGPFNNGGVGLAGALPTFISPIRATYTEATDVATISYDNGATVAQTIAAFSGGGPFALTGVGAGLTITSSGLTNNGNIITFELPAQTMQVRVELPACFSGMMSGADYFKNAAEIWLYMTTKDSVSTYFLAQRATVDRSANVHFDPALSQLPYVTFTIAKEPPFSADQIYTAGGELENSAAPPSRTLETYRDRVLALSGYDNKLYYTKPRIAGRGIEWSQSDQFFELPDDCLGVASNETCFLIFTKRGVYAIEGYGPSATGVPANAFGTMQLITNQVGLYEVNSCKTTPVGVIFRTSQGWWLIDRSLSLSEISSDISGMVGLADQTLSIEVDARYACIKIAMVPGGFGNAASKVYNYWYDSKRWSTDVFASGFNYRDAMVAGDVYFLLNGNDVLARSSPAYGTSWTDGSVETVGHGPNIQTGWITVANLAMLKRIWRVIAVVENLTPGIVTNPYVRLDVWADWDDSAPIFTGIWTADVIGPGVQTLRGHLPKQKMKAIRVSLQELPGASVQNNNPGYNFIGLGFMIGVKNRTSPEPVARSG